MLALRQPLGRRIANDGGNAQSESQLSCRRFYGPLPTLEATLTGGVLSNDLRRHVRHLPQQPVRAQYRVPGGSTALAARLPAALNIASITNRSVDPTEQLLVGHVYSWWTCMVSSVLTMIWNLRNDCQKRVAISLHKSVPLFCLLVFPGYICVGCAK